MVIVPSTRAARAVAHLEDVGDRVLREPPHARREEEDQRDADPRPRRLPQRGEARHDSRGPRPPNRLPEPIQVESSVNTSTCAGSVRPATRKSSPVRTARERQ